MSQKKYYAKNLEPFALRNLLFSTALTVPKLHQSLPNYSFETVNAVQINKFLGSQSSKFLAHYFGLTKV